jgi:PAS domain S-box-containing protein
LILLSFAFSKCLDLLLAGLTASLDENRVSGEKLERANRLYQFISQINQTIVHVKDAETLFRKSCDIALEFGKYNMAWISSFDTTRRRIVLQDASGVPENDLKLFADLPYDPDGPEEYVLRTGKYFCSNNIEHTSDLGAWELYAKRHKLKSCIVLPIEKSGSIYGTFNLYATERDYFDQDDIALLIEVTGDIAFALEMFDNAERHKAAEFELQIKFAELEAISKQQSAILNALPASIALLDNTGRILKVNDEWIHFGEMNGLEASYEHLGKDYIEVAEKAFGNDAEDGRRMAAGLRAILSSDQLYFAMEYPCHSPTEKRWYKVAVRPFKSQQVIGAVVMHFNISDRKKAEAEMLLLINNTEESFILLNDHLQIVSFNIQFKNLYAKFFGLEVQKGDSILDYAPPERKERTIAIYKRVLQGSVEESEIAKESANGTKNYFSLKYSPAKDEYGNIFGAFVTAVDITEKKKAIEQKEFERSNKEALINSTNDLIWSISNELKLIAANSAFIQQMKTLTGVEIKPGDDFLNFEVFSIASLEQWRALYERAFWGESFKTELYSPPTADWDQSWLEASFSPIIVNDQMAGIACYSRDITERKLAELERAKITNDLLQRNRDLEQFTFIISHNLRAPTANIMGITEYLQDETIAREEQRELLRALSSSVTGLDTVIKDINTILQVKHEGNEKKELISFTKLVKDILRSLDHLNEKNNVFIRHDFSEVDEIFSFKVYLQSIFYNLISNAIKYSKPNEQARIEIQSKKEDGAIILTFKDNGLGIDLIAKGDKIFRLYARFHSHVEGKGMGLYMVKTQVEAIGGRISVASEVGQGTEFTITINT